MNSNFTRRRFLHRTIAGAAAAGLAARFNIMRAAEGGTALRVGVIGHTGRGDYGHNVDLMWRHVPGTTVVAVADPVPAGLEKERHKLGDLPGFADYQTMLTQVRPDIVAVCPRYVDEHHAMCLAAIQSGAKGVYVDKPLCRSCAEADEIVAACEQRGTKLAIGHRCLYHPALLTVLKLVSDGTIGQLLELRGRGKEDRRGGGEDLWVLGAHIMSLAVFFGGQPIACTGTLLKKGRPVERSDLVEGSEGIGPIAGNEVHARFEMERGVPFFFDSVAGVGSGPVGFGLQIVGTKGVIDIRCDVDPTAHLMVGSPFVPTTEPRAWVSITTAGVGQPEPLADVKELVAAHGLAGRDLVAAIREDRAPFCDVRNGRVVVEMVSAVLESHRTGGARVAWPLKTRVNPLTLLR